MMSCLISLLDDCVLKVFYLNSTAGFCFDVRAFTLALIMSGNIRDATQKHAVNITSDGTRVFNDLKKRQSTNNIYKNRKTLIVNPLAHLKPSGQQPIPAWDCGTINLHLTSRGSTLPMSTDEVWEQSWSTSKLSPGSGYRIRQQLIFAWVSS